MILIVLLGEYELVETVGNANGTYQVNDQEVIYYYQKKFEVKTLVSGVGVAHVLLSSRKKKILQLYE